MDINFSRAINFYYRRLVSVATDRPGLATRDNIKYALSSYSSCGIETARHRVILVYGVLKNTTLYFLERELEFHFWFGVIFLFYH